MDKRTILAIVLSMVVMIGFLFVQNLIYPPAKNQTTTAAPAAGGGQSPAEPGGAAGNAGTAPPSMENQAPAPAPESRVAAAAVPSGETVPARTVTIETDLIKAVLSNAGGEITSFQLKKHRDGAEPVEMIFAGDAGPQAFAVAFGSMEDVIAKKISPERQNFRVRQVSNLIVEFSQDFGTLSGGSFTMTKRYEFKPGEYMFELTITLDGGRSVGSFDFHGAAYTLIFSPQIGPKFEKLDQRYEYRNYLTYKGKLRTEKVNETTPGIITTQPSWAAIAGKYFTLIGLPYASQYEVGFSAQNEAGLPAASRLYFSRPALNISRTEDKYQFYLGPKNQETLTVYERGDNAFKLRETGLLEIANTKGFLAPLETLLKWILMFFYKIIPNYGISIILLTLLVKLVTFPLTKKGSESTMRMQALSPKIKEIQAKYKDNPQKMNAEMAVFYKKEGYNPLSGCLPMIIQIPIFFAMYNLFNNHFDLRGAEFIPIWIPDLSRPESIYNFPGNFHLPLLGWNAIRLLPFIYVGSQLLYGKVTQTPDQQGNTQMKLMLYAMPIVFFFILYDVPSGLLIYWIMSNVLTMVQQLSINKYIAHKKALAAASEEAKPVIAPGPGGSKKKKKR